jgi:hypothetical protein
MSDGMDHAKGCPRERIRIYSKHGLLVDWNCLCVYVGCTFMVYPNELRFEQPIIPLNDRLKILAGRATNWLHALAYAASHPYEVRIIADDLNAVLDEIQRREREQS